MPNSSYLPRRDFLRRLAIATGSATAMSVLPSSIEKALAIPANRRTRSLRDVEHVVILMQENRSFDHYFGTLRGVRGFGDRFPIPVPDRPGIEGKTVWLHPSRALSYVLHVHAAVDADSLTLTFDNDGRAGAVFHVYDRMQLEAIPRRYTVEAGKRLSGTFALTDGAYDLWVLGPNGFHRHLVGAPRVSSFAPPEAYASYEPIAGNLLIWVHNPSNEPVTFEVTRNAYKERGPSALHAASNARALAVYGLRDSGHWYDLTLTSRALPGWSRRFAGRVETGRHGISDPALGGKARSER